MATVSKDEAGNIVIEYIPGMLDHMFPDNSLALSVQAAVHYLLNAGELLWANGRYSWAGYVPTTTDVAHRNTVTAESVAITKFFNEICTLLRSVACPDSGRLLNFDLKARYWTTARKNKLLSEDSQDSLPYLCLTSVPEGSSTWKYVLSTIQLSKGPSSREAVNELRQRLTNNATMALSRQYNRRFYVGATVSGYDMRVYQADRSGLVGTTVFDIRDDPHSLLRFLIALALSPTSLIGVDDSIEEMSGIQTVTISKVKYRLIQRVFRSNTISGRGTTIWKAVLKSDPEGKTYAIKDTWTDTSRIAEDILLAEAAGIEGLPMLIGSDVVRATDGRGTTATIRSIVNKEITGAIEAREHRRLVLTPFAENLCEFSSKRELLSVLIDAITAHRDLVIQKGILHRDISEGNIMFYRPLAPHSDNGSGITHVKGLLLDLDYAVHNDVPNRDRAIGHRIASSQGTLPFMSINVLRNRDHKPRDDLESFFYVLVWICINYVGPNNAPRQDIDISSVKTVAWTAIGDWNSYEALADNKVACFRDQDEEFEEHILALIPPYFEDLCECLIELRQLIFFSKNPTHDAMTAILLDHLLRLPVDEQWSEEKDPHGYRLNNTKSKGKKAVARPKGRLESHSTHRMQLRSSGPVPHDAAPVVPQPLRRSTRATHGARASRG